MARCADELATEVLWMAKLSANAGSHDDQHTEMTFAEGASAMHVACALLLRLGAYSSAPSPSFLVRLPADIGSIVLTGDIVVFDGSSLTLEGALGTELVMGPWQLKVDRGGKLDLLRIRVVDTRGGGSALYSEGGVKVLNSSFERCVTSTNLVLRSAERTVRMASSPAHAQAHGALLAASGGATMQMWSGAAFWASASRFLGNAARGGQMANFGGALSSFGGRITLDDGTFFAHNRAEGGSVSASGGAISTKIWGELLLDQAEFTQKKARGGPQTTYVRGPSNCREYLALDESQHTYPVLSADCASAQVTHFNDPSANKASNGHCLQGACRAWS